MEQKVSPLGNLERVVREFWGKFVEFIALGAEEAGRATSGVRTRVDLETLKVRRSRLHRELGRATYRAWMGDPTLARPETEEILLRLREVAGEMARLEKELDFREGAPPAGENPGSGWEEDENDPPPLDRPERRSYKNNL